jgi:hypothetical protein
MRSRTVDGMQVGAIWTGLVALLGLGGVLTGAWILSGWRSTVADWRGGRGRSVEPRWTNRR